MKLKIFFTIVMLSSYLNAHHYHNDAIKVSYASNWSPYSYKNKETGKAEGVLVRIIDELLHKKLGLKVLHEIQPWARAQVSVKNGNLDALFTQATKDRLKYTLSSKPFYNSEWYLFVSTKNSFFENIMKMEDPLKNKKFIYLSVIGDKTTQEFYNKYDLKFYEPKTVMEAITMLDSGRASLFLHSKLAAISAIYSLNLSDEIKIHKKEYKKVPFSFLLSKNTPHADRIIKDLNKLIETMSKDGSLEQMTKKIEEEEVIKFLKEKDLY